MTLRIKNWDKFQHYKSGKNASKRPEWIRLYTRLLDDIEFDNLSGDDAKALIMLWALASEQEGDLPDTKTIAFRLRLTESKLQTILGRLAHWVEGPPRTGVAECPRTEEKRIEENRKEEKRERRAHALPPDWVPSANHFLQGSELGFSASKVESMAVDMRLWAGAKDETKKNWDMAFSSWIRREKKNHRGTGPPAKEKHFRSVVQEHLEEVDSANIIEPRPSGRVLCGPDSERGSGQLHAATPGHENHVAPVDASLHRKAEIGFEDDGQS